MLVSLIVVGVVGFCFAAESNSSDVNFGLSSPALMATTAVTTASNNKTARAGSEGGGWRIDYDEGDCEKKMRCRRLPNALIIGAKKAGTRAVLEFIRLHPDVRAAGKELHFFDRDYFKGVDYYRSEMPLSRPNHLVVEKTPAYFTDTLAPIRIRRTLGTDVRLILVVRNPVDRLLSDYAQTLYKVKQQLKKMSRPGGSSPPPSPSALLKPFSELAFVGHNKKKGGPSRLVVNSNFSSLNIGYYAEHLARFISAGFSLKKNIHIVNGDELARNPGPEMVRLQKFLSLNPMIDESSFYFDEEKGFSCVRDPLVLKNPGGNGTALSKSGRHRRRRCLGPSKGGRQREHPKLTQLEREVLVRFYAPYNAKLFKLIGKRYPLWNCYAEGACI